MMTGKLISPDRPAVLAVMVLTTTILAAGCAEAAKLSSSQSDTTAQRHEEMQQHPYVGMWITADGHIRQELLPTCRYDEARGSRKSAYQGRYEVKGNQIVY
jgi:Agrobacterium tumefaciens protein Atu4866